MTKQQENKAFVKMLKEFPKAFGRVSFRERLMLRTAFTYVLEARYEDKDSIVRLLSERCNQLLKDKGDLTDKVAEMVKENTELKRDKEDLIFVRNQKADYINELKDQLTKAKELLKRWVELYKLEGYPITPIQEQTEQFLKEIEK